MNETVPIPNRLKRVFQKDQTGNVFRKPPFNFQWYGGKTPQKSSRFEKCFEPVLTAFFFELLGLKFLWPDLYCKY